MACLRLEVSHVVRRSMKTPCIFMASGMHAADHMPSLTLCGIPKQAPVHIHDNQVADQCSWAACNNDTDPPNLQLLRKQLRAAPLDRLQPCAVPLDRLQPATDARLSLLCQ